MAGALAVFGLGVGAVWYAGSHRGAETPAAAVAPSQPATPASSEAPKPAPPPAAKPAPRTYTAHVVVVPATARIVLDGRDVGPSPFDWTFSTDGAAHTLDVSAEGFETQKVSFQDAPPPPRIALSPRPVALPARNRPTGRKHAAAPAAQPERPAPRETPPPWGANGAPVID